MPIEARGRRDDALAAALKAGKLPETATYDYVVGRKPLRVGTEVRQPGDPIPEAATWPRLESWLRSGAVEQRPAGSVTPAEPRRPAPAAKKTAARKRPAPPTDQEQPKPALRPRIGAST